MKLSALHQNYLNRRSTSFRNSSSPLDSDSSAKSPSSIFWLAIHTICCLVSLILGFRFSRLVLFLLFSTTTTETLTVFNANDTVRQSIVSSRVQVGRHGIRIRPWPHPDPVEVMKAHRIMDRVQTEQRLLHGVKRPYKTVIAVTPTYVRTFQTLHLTGVMHSLMNVPYDVVWIVVEAGGTTSETALFVAKSGLKVIHVGLDQRMPILWEERHRMEARMRLRALRIVRDEKLDGVVMFADDSNMHSMELFDEIQNVRWIGAVSIGILAHSSNTDEYVSRKLEDEESSPLPIQGPACNSSKKLVGWHTFNSTPYVGKRAISIDDRAPVLPIKLEWSGFVLNSRLLWKDAEDKPEWVEDLDSVDADLESPLSLLRDTSVVEPLGECGRKVMLWWLRVEARTDSKFPRGWIINPPLEVTVPAKRTPWPDVPPELPTTEKVTSIEEELTEKRPTKNRPSRSKHNSRSKRKREPRVISTQVSAGHSD